MTTADVLDLLRLAMWTLLLTSAPALIAAMATGTAIAVLQTLTQVQEATLTFVPKIIAVLAVLAVSSGLIGSAMMQLAKECFERIATPVN